MTVSSNKGMHCQNMSSLVQFLGQWCVFQLPLRSTYCSEGILILLKKNFDLGSTSVLL